MATGYGIYQQLKLPERILEYVEWYVDEHGRVDEEAEERRPRRSARRGDEAIDQEIASLSEQKPVPTTSTAPVRGGGFCPRCGTSQYQDAIFCHECGTRLAGPTPPAASTPTETPRPSPDDEA